MRVSLKWLGVVESQHRPQMVVFVVGVKEGDVGCYKQIQNEMSHHRLKGFDQGEEWMGQIHHC